MNVQHLKIAARALEAWKPNPRVAQFDMAEWLIDDPHCGTSACAIGIVATAGVIPELSMGWNLGAMLPQYHGVFCWAAVEECFGLNSQDACWLFDGDVYPENVVPADVAARIREFLAVA